MKMCHQASGIDMYVECSLGRIILLSGTILKKYQTAAKRAKMAFWVLTPTVAPVCTILGIVYEL